VVEEDLLKEQLMVVVSLLQWELVLVLVVLQLVGERQLHLQAN